MRPPAADITTQRTSPWPPAEGRRDHGQRQLRVGVRALTTLLHEKHGHFWRQARRAGRVQGHAGQADVQVADLDTEIKTVQLDTDLLAPPDRCAASA